MNPGWIKHLRTAETLELLKDKESNHLLNVIALRAKRTTDFNVQDLKVGEALIGDFKNYDMTRQEYRTAKKKLEKWGLATFRSTNKGTIAKLTDKRIYDINIETPQPPEQPADNHQATKQQPSNNHQSTTNKNDNTDNNGKKEKEDNRSSIDSTLSSEQNRICNLLIQHGVNKTVADSIVYEQKHPLESIKAAISNALVKKAEVAKTDEFSARQFNIAGYIVTSLNQARKEGKVVNESKSVNALNLKKKQRESYKPHTQEEFKKRQCESIKAILKKQA